MSTLNDPGPKPITALARRETATKRTRTRCLRGEALSNKWLRGALSILNSLSSRSSRFESPIPFSRPTSRAGSSCGFVPSSPEPKLPLFRPLASPCFSNSPSNFSNSPCFSNSSPAYLPPSWASAPGSSQESTTRVIRINQQSLLTSSTTLAPADNNNEQQLFSRLACPQTAPHPSPSSPLLTQMQLSTTSSPLQPPTTSSPTPGWRPSSRPGATPSPIFQPTK